VLVIKKTLFYTLNILTSIIIYVFSSITTKILHKDFTSLKNNKFIVVKIMGGLGNQLFQFAFYLEKKVHRHHNEIVLIDIDYYNKYDIHNGYELYNIFGINAQNMDDFLAEKYPLILKYLKCIDYLRKFDAFGKFKKLGLSYIEITDEAFLTSFPDRNLHNVIFFNGFWTSKTYWDKITNEIHNAFVFPQLTGDYLLELKKSIECSESVSIHIRRGDYVTNDLFVTLSEDYYLKAITLTSNLVRTPVFYVFSDDIDFCKRMIKKIYNGLSNVVFVEINDQRNYLDLQLMSLCKHNIIANSTFSWWAAELNKNSGKTIIAPQIYYTDTPSNYLWIKLLEKGYFYQKNWIKI